MAAAAGYASLRVLEILVAKNALLFFSLYCAAAAIAGLAYFR